jgi:rod shape determining protein RodA
MNLTPRILWQKLVAPIDGPLFLLAMILLACALIVLASAAVDSPQRIANQAMNMGVALVIMRVVAQIPPQLMMRLAVPAYVGGLVLLVLVALFGDISKGARRWLDLGVTRIQPSEVMKIALPLMLAWYFHKHEETLRLREFAIAALLLAVPVGLIARQPDLGTAILVLAAGFYVIFFAGLSWKVMTGLAVSALAAAPLLWSVLHDYQRHRILTLLDPEQDPLGKGFHTIQSTIAVGSGGITGKGWMNGTQTHLEFIPERHTDFIFAVWSEEFGLIGNIVLLGLYALFIGRGLIIAANAPTLFGRLMAGTVTLSFFTYAFVNMGMVSGILPVVGVPLPLVSYGGTAMVTLFLGIGILMSISRNRMLVQK